MNELSLAEMKDMYPESFDRVPFTSFNIPASAPTNRKNRRALVKALGIRQFKKLYRKAQA